MKGFVILLCSISVLCFSSCKEANAQGGFEQITVKDLNKILKTETIQLVDVRTPKEYKSGYIKSAQNINYSSPDFANNLKVLDLQKPVYIYCRSGRRSAKSIKDFQKAGFTKIYDLQGGILLWNKNGMEIVEK